MKKIKIPRGIVLLILFIMMFLILIIRLFQLQIVHGQEYVENFKLKTKREIVLAGTRGNIYDRNGNLLAGNQLAYSVTFEDNENYETDRERQLSLNGRIYQITRIIKSHGDLIENSLKIRLDKNGVYQFTAEGFALKRFKADVYGRNHIEDMKEAEKNASAEEIITFLTDKFCIYTQNDKKYTNQEKEAHGLPEVLKKEELLDVLHIRYALSLQAYQKYLSVPVAKDISEETMAAVLENQSELSGVDIKEDSIRIYEGGEAFASVLGYTGVISPDELDEKKKDGYNAQSIVGKAGMEQYLDASLQGKDGKKEVYVDNMGRTMEDAGVTTEPVAGEDVYLSIDMNLQQKTYDAIEQKIVDILLEHFINAKTFDKESVSDTTEILIPVYDAYVALLNNGLIDLEALAEEEASELERSIYQRITDKKTQVIQELEGLLNGEDVPYQDLSKEIQAYQKIIIQELNLTETESDKEIATPLEQNEMSVNTYLREAIGGGYIRSSILDSDEKYLNQNEVYQLLTSYIIKMLQQNLKFEKTICQYMVLNDEVSPYEILMLLYEQQTLDIQDGDFEKWQQGVFSDYELFLEKLQKLEITPADLALDPCSGSAVVIDTKTGKVLACVSYPGYDNNRLANQMDNDYYYQIYNNASLPLYNRATQQLSAPGSTFKPITLIAGIEEGVIGNSTTVMCDGIFDKVEPSLRCWNHAGHGSVVSVANALKNSCNDYLCEISYRLGLIGNQLYSDEQALNYLQDYAKRFDLDKKSGIELAESSPQITDRYAIPSSIGQGTNNFSTVQLGRYVTTLANSGTSFQLSLIDNMNGTETEAKIESQVELSEASWDGVHAGMEQYAETTGIFKGFPMSAAGKSGTAQENKRRPDHGLFVGYAPSENPEIAVAVRIVNGYEANCAVECGRKIFETYFNVE